MYTRLIIREKGARMIETMLKKRLNAQVQQSSQNILNKKPILFAVNTSDLFIWKLESKII
jgi:hypothetical protein